LLQNKEFKIDDKSNHYKNVSLGFFMMLGLTVAETHTILPLIISYFGGGAILVGFYSSLLKGGAILVQLYAAFHAQSYPLVLKYMKLVFFIRFLAWFSIGFFILLLGNNYPNITLFFIGLGLFIFSFSAGFGVIFFKELMAKMFTHKFRGKSMATRQFFSAFAAIISGTVAGYMLELYEPPYNFGILFVLSSFIIGIGYLIFVTATEPVKTNVAKKEKSFKEFLQNSKKILKTDKTLQIQIITFLFAYSYLFALPFIILDAQAKINLDGIAIGLIITAQMLGAMLSNIIWGKLSGNGENKKLANITIFMSIIAIVFAFFATSLFHFMIIFFIIGASMDGTRLSSWNLIIIISPEKKRPVYNALQTNITSIGMFFSLFGGVILHFTNYQFLYSFTICMLLIGLTFSFFLKDE
jgi:MFS family permease